MRIIYHYLNLKSINIFLIYIKKLVVILCFLTYTIDTSGQSISEYLFGQNAWLSSISNGELESLTAKLNNEGDETFNIIRIGGTSYDDNFPSFNQIRSLIAEIRSIGAEPLIQIPLSKGINYGADLIQFINNEQNLNVKFWSIGNEPDLGWLDEMVDGRIINSADDIAYYFMPRASAMKAADSSIKIFGPDYSFFVDAVDNPDWHPMDTWHYPLLDNNEHGLWGTDANGNYYIDYYAFHVYQFVAVDNVERKLEIVLDHIKDINSNYRDANNSLGWAITETHITTNNGKEDDHDKTWSFYAGQHIAQIIGLGMKHEAFCINPWSMHESGGFRDNAGGYSNGDFDLGFFDQSPSFNPRSTFYHEKILSDHAKSNYVLGHTNDPKLKQIATRDDTGYAIMIMNDNNYDADFTLSLDNNAQENTFLISVDANLSNQVKSHIEPYETQMLFLDINGDLIGSITYNKENEEAKEAPVYSGNTPSNTLSNNDENSFSSNIIYPNPVTNGHLNIINHNEENVLIYDIMGKLIFQSTSSPIDVSTALPGIYFVKINKQMIKIIIK